MDLESALKYVWEDKDWLKKFGVAALLILSVIGSFALFGWLGEIARRVAAEEEEILPGWEPLGDYFLNGLKIFAITFVWSLPVILVIIGTSVGFISTTFIEDPGPFIAVISVFSICLYVFIFLYIIAINLLSPPLWLLLAEGGSIRKLVNPKHAWALFRANIGSYLVTMLIGWLIAAILSPLGAVVCLVGALFTSLYSQTTLAHLVGQATRQARTNMAEANELS